MKRLLSRAIAIATACAPLAAYAESSKFVESFMRGLLPGAFLIGSALLIAYVKRKRKERADLESSKSDLAQACANGNTKKVAALIEAGADVNEQDENGGTALMLAARNNRLAVAAYLLEHGARPDLKTKSGLSASDIAMKHGYSRVVDVIHKKGQS